MDSRATIDCFEGARHVQLRRDLDVACAGARCLADHAQAACSLVYERSSSTLALLRCWAVMRFADQPAGNQAFAREWLRRRQLSDRLQPDTPVLALMGSAGRDRDWNDRRRSAGHLALPLFSSVMLHKTPLVGALFEQLEIGTSWLDKPERGAIGEVGSRAAGQFFVPDMRKLLARTEARGLSGQGVRSAFGGASSYIGRDAFLIVLGFASVELDPRSAGLATLLARFIRAGTYRMVDAGRYFT